MLAPRPSLHHRLQDARLGPDTYDLVSLLRDSYVDLPWSTVDDLIAYFLALQGRSSAADREEFRRRFDLMALQRNLKALGTFGYQTVARGNPVYIQYMPRTLNYVRENLRRYPRFARLGGLLSEYIQNCDEPVRPVDDDLRHVGAEREGCRRVCEARVRSDRARGRHRTFRRAIRGGHRESAKLASGFRRDHREPGHAVGRRSVSVASSR
jgi:hypothetical protein